MQAGPKKPIRSLSLVFMERDCFLFNFLFVCVCVQGECCYERELLPYLHKEDTVKSRQKKQKGTKTCTKTANDKPKSSHSSWSELEYIDEEFEGSDTRTAGLLTTLAVMKQRPPAEDNNEIPYDDSTDRLKLEADIDKCETVTEDLIKADGEPVNLDNLSQLPAKSDEDEDVQLQAMFYLPKWDAAPLPCCDKLLPGRDESLKVILASVAELLSRSPPSLVDDLEPPPSLCPSPQQPPQPFLVSFTLDVDDDDDDDKMIMREVEKPPDELPNGKDCGKISPDFPNQEKHPVSVAANSPTWDEVFGEDINDINDIRDDSKESDDDEKCNGFREDQVHVEADDVSEEKQSWDDVRDEEIPHLTDGVLKDDKASECSSEMDESIDLFEDDEAFLQMTIPDIPTPLDGITPATSPTEKKSETVHVHTPINPCNTTQSADGTHRLRTVESKGVAFSEGLTHNVNAKLIIQNTNNHNTTVTELNMHTPAQTKTVADNSVMGSAVTPHFKSPESFNSMHDFFSVNFELGYSLEDSEEEDEAVGMPAPCMPGSSQPKKQIDSTTLSAAVSNSSTPCNSFAKQRIPPVCSESKHSTPQTLSECRMSKSGALPSPIMSPGAKRTLMPGLPSSLKRRRAQFGITVAERGPNEENGSYHVSGSSPHAGLFNLKERNSIFILSWFPIVFVSTCLFLSASYLVEGNSDSEDEVVLHKRRHPNKVNPLSSPEVVRKC